MSFKFERMKKLIALKEVRIFFYLRQLRVMALNVFSLVLFHICFAVLLIASEGANSYIAD